MRRRAPRRVSAASASRSLAPVAAAPDVATVLGLARLRYSRASLRARIAVLEWSPDRLTRVATTLLAEFPHLPETLDVLPALFAVLRPTDADPLARQAWAALEGGAPGTAYVAAQALVASPALSPDTLERLLRATNRLVVVEAVLAHPAATAATCRLALALDAQSAVGVAIVRCAAAWEDPALLAEVAARTPRAAAGPLLTLLIARLATVPAWTLPLLLVAVTALTGDAAAAIAAFERLPPDRRAAVPVARWADLLGSTLLPAAVMAPLREATIVWLGRAGHTARCRPPMAPG